MILICFNQETKTRLVIWETLRFFEFKQRNEERHKQKKEEKRERDQYALKEQMRVSAAFTVFKSQKKN